MEWLFGAMKVACLCNWLQPHSIFMEIGDRNANDDETKNDIVYIFFEYYNGL